VLPAGDLSIFADLGLGERELATICSRLDVESDRTYRAGPRRSCLRQFASGDLTNEVATIASYTLRTSG
jgi:hypothetical protein